MSRQDQESKCRMEDSKRSKTLGTRRASRCNSSKTVLSRDTSKTIDGRPEWLMENYDSGPAVTAVEIYLWKSKVSFELRQMNSTDESGDITEVAKPLLSAAEGSRRWDTLLFEDRGIFWIEIPLLLWRSEQFCKRTRPGIVMARASDFTEKETCAARMCDLEMSRRSLHLSSQPRRAGPDLEKWTWTVEIMMSRTKHNNLGNSGEFQLHVSPQSWRGRSILKRIMLCSHLGAKCLCKQKGTGAQHRRQTVKKMARQEQEGPRISSDFFDMSEPRV